MYVIKKIEIQKKKNKRKVLKLGTFIDTKIGTFWNIPIYIQSIFFKNAYTEYFIHTVMQIQNKSILYKTRLNIIIVHTTMLCRNIYMT